MILARILPLVACLVLAVASPAPARRWLNFGYGLGEKVRGVNIGGWLVLEPYINLSLFEQFGDSNGPVDEYHFCQTLGKDAAYSQLSQHWASWITQDDFTQIAAAGLNHVRIPIGYWAFTLLDSDPYVQGQVQYLEQGLQWAREAGLKVWIDIHGMPGSQNGFDNSGQRDVLTWTSDVSNYQLSQQIVANVIKTYSASEWNDVVVAIQPVNEPLASNGVIDINMVKDYYGYSYEQLRTESGSDIVLAIHDGFMGTTYWNDFMTYPDFYNVILDHHAYQVFSAGELSRSIDDHISSACGEGTNIQGTTLWTVTGEWSAALTDCAKWLNGYGRGARYEGQYDGSPYYGSCTGKSDITTWSDDDKANTRKYIEAQMDAYEQGLGWIFWCWKTEGALEWDFQALIANGLVPQPLDSRTYPNQCGF
ncbi:Xog1 Exo-1,3-beta-glucanase [Myxozyma melibiosi]|uniref:glucan 1,3-beta-glucosidase n=1 Tax=Myxozyma melibiosi TaxID=54550 RepID=A0ABR1FBH2_9ASCO